MNKFDLEESYEKYDKDLLVLLEILGRINLNQFLADLKINDKETYKEVKRIIQSEVT